MEKRPNAVTFKGQPKTLCGPQLKAGDKAPECSCVNGSLEVTKFSGSTGKPRLISVVPSLDTAVCSTQTKKFNQEMSSLKDKAACYTVSLDLPFAQKRFCSSEGISNMEAVSDAHDQSFGKNYGCLMEGMPVPLLSRAVFVVDKAGKICYAEYCSEVTNQPNYDQALAALKKCCE